MQKKNFIIIIVLIIIVAIAFILYKPSQAPAPSATSTDQVATTTTVATTTDHSNLIKVTSPKPNETISSPVTITGEARGGWYFEASFPVNVVDWDGRIIGEGVAQAQGDWMTENFVPFKAVITFKLPPESAYSKKGTLILKKDNPSGLPQNEDALEMPIMFK